MVNETPPTSYETGYDSIADIYDEDMGRSASGWDVGFYTRRCAGLKTAVLELGCGTGRITLPLARSGVRVVGVDNSLPMIMKLKQKAAAPEWREAAPFLSLCCMDMRRVAFRTSFGAVICPYSAFTYLVDESERACALERVREHLAPGGALILDVFIPNPAVTALPDEHTIFDYRRMLSDGTVVERTKTIAKDVLPGVNLIRRHYRFSAPSGTPLREVRTQEIFRYYSPDQLSSLLARSGFSVEETVYDTGGATGTSQPKTVAFVCRKTGGHPVSNVRLSAGFPGESAASAGAGLGQREG